MLFSLTVEYVMQSDIDVHAASFDEAVELAKQADINPARGTWLEILAITDNKTGEERIL